MSLGIAVHCVALVLLFFPFWYFSSVIFQACVDQLQAPTLISNLKATRTHNQISFAEHALPCVSDLKQFEKVFTACCVLRFIFCMVWNAVLCINCSLVWIAIVRTVKWFSLIIQRLTWHVRPSLKKKKMFSSISLHARHLPTHSGPTP